LRGAASANAGLRLRPTRAYDCGQRGPATAVNGDLRLRSHGSVRGDCGRGTGDGVFMCGRCKLPAQLAWRTCMIIGRGVCGS